MHLLFPTKNKKGKEKKREKDDKFPLSRSKYITSRVRAGAAGEREREEEKWALSDSSINRVKGKQVLFRAEETTLQPGGPARIFSYREEE